MPGPSSPSPACNKGFLSSERHCVQGTSPLLHILSPFNLQTTLGAVGTIIPITQRSKLRPRHSWLPLPGEAPAVSPLLLTFYKWRN